ncbi:MAG: NAD(+)/NADH kinase [Planctomycetota bacterium]|nr:MAG: NAD(+)/NADH kinase [Planctomycetota bacterium]
MARRLQRNGVDLEPLSLPRGRPRVLICADPGKAGALRLARQLRAHLAGSATVLGIENARSRRPIRSRPDLLVVLGGDGTMLNACRRLGERHAPVLGVNFGSVGFLAAVAPQRAQEVLDAALGGAGECESHALMRARLRRGRRVLLDTHFLNEVVVLRGASQSMAEVDLSVDGRAVCTYRGDGVIVATATGSTAYSLAAGGPVLSPRLDACVVTPVAAYTLDMRPLVLPGNGQALLRTRAAAELTVDGHQQRPLRPGDAVEVGPSARRFRLIVDPRAGFYARLRGKLRWGLQPGPGEAVIPG